LAARFNPAVGLAVGLPIGVAMVYHDGPAVGVPAGIAFTAAFGLLDGLSQTSISVAIPAAPLASWQQNRAQARSVALAFGAMIGLAGGVSRGLADAADHGPAVGLATGSGSVLGVGLVSGLAAWVAVSETWRTTLVFLQLGRRRVAPRRGMRFLQDAHERGVLRTAGPVYQFRHARLQDQLAEKYLLDHDWEEPSSPARSIPSAYSGDGVSQAI